MKSQKSKVIFISATVLFVVVFLLTSLSWADIYKWRDASGKIHFSDSLMEIPNDFLTEKHLEKMRMMDLGDPEEEARKKQLKADQEREKLEKQQTAKKQQLKKKKGAISVEERKVLANASFFLKNNIIAYKRHLGKPVGEELFKNIKKITQISIDPKTKLIDQLSKFKSPASKQTLKLLQTSLVIDKEFDNTKVYVKPSADPMIIRLKNGIASKDNIVKMIKQALVSSKPKATVDSSPKINF